MDAPKRGIGPPCPITWFSVFCGPESWGDNDLSAVPQRELFSITPRGLTRFRIQHGGPQALAMPHLRPPILRLARGGYLRGLRALSALRKLRP